jgi:hypothetical protein
MLLSTAFALGGPAGCARDHDEVVDLRTTLETQRVSYSECPIVEGNGADTALVVADVPFVIRVPVGTRDSTSEHALAWRSNDGLLITVAIAPKRAFRLDALLREVGPTGVLSDCLGTSDFGAFVGAVGSAGRGHMGPGLFGTARWFLKDGRTISVGVAAPGSVDTARLWRVLTSARFKP